MITLALVLAAVCALLFGSIPVLALAVTGLLLKLYPLLALLVFAAIVAWAINHYWR